MMTRSIIFLAGALAFATLAQAQQPQLTAPTPPSELEQEQHRSAMLSAQLQVFADALRVSEAKRGQAERDAAVLAGWWAQYVAGLAQPPPKGQK